MLRLVLAAAFRRGVLGGSRTWTVLGGAALGLRVLRKLTGGGPEVVYCDEIRPGESLVISHDREPRATRTLP